VEPLNPGFDISVAGPEDLTELAALINSAYRGDSSRKGWTTEADLLDDLRTDPVELAREIRTPGHAILCLRRFGERPIVGSVLLRNMGIEGAHRVAYLGMLTIQPEIQAQGLGRHLLQGAEDYARANWDAHRMIMTVINVRTELLAWYERRGYHPTGRTDPFPGRTDFHFIVLSKAL
jgi:ribosomal protein S18 acetylase RimI-like enzyme